MTAEDYGQGAEAVKAYMTVNLLPKVLEDAFELWNIAYRDRWFPDDHGSNFSGPAYSAEGAVNQPMILDICGHASAESWPECSSCPPS